MSKKVDPFTTKTTGVEGVFNSHGREKYEANSWFSRNIIGEIKKIKHIFSRVFGLITNTENTDILVNIKIFNKEGQRNSEYYYLLRKDAYDKMKASLENHYLYSHTLETKHGVAVLRMSQNNKKINPCRKKLETINFKIDKINNKLSNNQKKYGIQQVLNKIDEQDFITNNMKKYEFREQRIPQNFIDKINQSNLEEKLNDFLNQLNDYEPYIPKQLEALTTDSSGTFYNHFVTNNSPEEQALQHKSKTALSEIESQFKKLPNSIKQFPFIVNLSHEKK